MEKLDGAQLEAAQKQYKLYVRMAEAMVDRRAEVNRFYLTLNTSLVGAIGFLIGDGQTGAALRSYLPILPILGVMICLIWLGILSSQRKLLGVKFEVIHTLEARLPFQPYIDEWERSNGNAGKKPSFAKFESRLPWVFFLIYALGLWFLAQPWLAQVQLLMGDAAAALTAAA